MWSSKVKPHLKRNAVAYSLFLMAFFGGIVALTINAFLFPQKVFKQQEENANAELSPTVDESLVALRRASSNALQICWDSGVDGFLFQFDEEGVLKWWYVEKRPMWKSENGTWMTKPIQDNEWHAIAPDATGLKCNIKQ